MVGTQGKILEIAYLVEPPVYYIFASIFMSDNYSLPCFIGKVIGNDFSGLTNFVKPAGYLWYLRNVLL